MSVFPRCPGGARTADELYQHQEDEYARPDICGSVNDAQDSDAIIQYIHHGTLVSVREHLQGRHRDHCLCFAGCAYFKPGTGDNCPRAQELYEFDVRYDMTTPVWECPLFHRASDAEA